MERLFSGLGRGILLLVAGWLLSGCLGVNPVTPTQFYILNPMDHDPGLVQKTQTPFPLSVEIASLRLPQYLEKPQIITRSHQNRLEIAEYHQWGGNLRKNMIRVLAQNMSQLLATPDIAMAPFRPLTTPDFRIDVEVMQFESDAQGQVHFSAQWRLSRGKDGKLLTTRMVNLKSPLPDTQPDFDRIVFVMGELLGDFSHTIAKEILDQSAKAPSP
ncbi:MAG: PqiC family protein [Proteobacteria bacterium]|nr:membrane integrity-associated transporter subunit PqiC [Desulfobacula sp.]MBU3950671.1 PqiC family protein [Pseudomonadota bacterium]MBU4129915.1 PqiC family protein [Pseudomonadota bacterium]